MSLIAIYVYSPTTFQIDGRIDCFDASTFASRTLTPDKPVALPAGVYRLAATASVTPTSGAGFEIVHIELAMVNGTKKPFPDPPIEADKQLGFGKDQAHTFFGGLSAPSTF